jgi:F-type H+-transporting ATPase subunit alpha
MKTAVGTLKGDLSQFRELEAFAAFGSELDKVSQAALDRGYRLVELLKQPLHSPLPVEEQVISIYCGTQGILDDLPAEQVTRFESDLLEDFRTRHVDLLGQIKDTGQLPDEEKLRAAIDDFKARFKDMVGGEIAADEAAMHAENPESAVGESA